MEQDRDHEHYVIELPPSYADATATRGHGCHGFTLSFWFFVGGMMFPILWLPGMCGLASNNPTERTWAQACFLAFVVSMILAISFISSFHQELPLPGSA